MRRLLSVVFLLAACGDPLVNGDFVGDAKLKLQAIVCGEESDIVPVNPRVGILWKSYDSETGYELTEVTQVKAAEFPTVVDLEVYGPAPASAEIGCPILFDDLDGDESFGAADPILAVSWNQLISVQRDSFQVLEGICSDDGQPSGQFMPIMDRPIDISFLSAPNDLTMPTADSCVRFF